MGRIAKVAKQRSNSYIIIYTTGKQTLRIAKVAQQRSNSYIIIYYRETDLQNCESCAATQQFVYHYYTTGKQICRIARIAKQCSNSYIIIYIGRFYMNTTKHDLFYGIKESEQSEMLKCFNSYTRSYSAGEIICFFDEPDAGIGIVEEGEACIIHSLSNGSQTILEHLKPGDLFGQMFYYHANRENITLEASKKCTIRYIDYQHIVKRCIKSCQHHSQLVSNILMMVSDKTKDICEHLEAVSQRSIRDKLMTYFETLSSKNNSNTFTIPFTMSSLADYLSIDRSAMSRELGKMKDEGLIYIEKREVTINRFK